MKLKTEDVLLYGGLAFLAYKFLLPKAPPPAYTATHTMPQNYIPVAATPPSNTGSNIVSTLTAFAPVVADLLKPKTANPAVPNMPVNVYEQYDTPVAPQDYYTQTVNDDPTPLESYFQNGMYKNYGDNLAGIGSVQNERAGFFGWY